MLHQSGETPSRPGPDSKWTAEVRTRFLDQLACKGSVRAACLRVGVSAEIAYRLRRRDPAFARGWAAAMVLARRETEQVLAEQAVEGIVEDVYYRGERVGSKRRYDARLLLAHLARLDKLADNPQAAADAERFDELLAVIGGEDPPDELACADGVLPASRRRHLASAGDTARLEERHAQIAASPEQAGDEADEADDDLDEEERWQRETWAEEEREAACEEAAVEAMLEAAERWDVWQARAHAAVDRVLAVVSPPVNPGRTGECLATPVDDPHQDCAAGHRQQCQQSGEGDP